MRVFLADQSSVFYHFVRRCNLIAHAQVFFWAFPSCHARLHCALYHEEHVNSGHDDTRLVDVHFMPFAIPVTRIKSLKIQTENKGTWICQYIWEISHILFLIIIYYQRKFQSFFHLTVSPLVSQSVRPSVTLNQQASQSVRQAESISRAESVGRSVKRLNLSIESGRSVSQSVCQSDRQTDRLSQSVGSSQLVSQSVSLSIYPPNLFTVCLSV